jgi:hypothetical protein
MAPFALMRFFSRKIFRDVNVRFRQNSLALALRPLAMDGFLALF